MSETIELTRDCGAIAIPSGRRRLIAKGTAVRVVQARETSYTIAAADRAMYRIDAQDADALGFGSPKSEAKEPKDFNEKLVWETLRTVYDPELPVNVVELGLIYSCAIAPGSPDGNIVEVRMAMTSPGCGMSDVLKSEVETKLMRLPGVSKAHVEVVYDPPWVPSRISESARLQLGIDAGRDQAFVQISRDR